MDGEVEKESRILQLFDYFVYTHIPFCRQLNMISLCLRGEIAVTTVSA